MTSPVTHVAVVGAGIGGLMSALALERLGIRTTLFERDEQPPRGIAPADSMAWRRKGVPQSLHPHFFMGRLFALLEARYPDLLAALRSAGASENALEDYVHPARAARLSPHPEDGQLRSINMRRTTFEMTVREHVERKAGIAIVNHARVVDLTLEGGSNGSPRVTGLMVEADGRHERVEADAVIDASGRFSQVAKALRGHGVALHDEQRDSGIVYLTRHYRLQQGASFPQAVGLPAARYPDFTLGALPADNGTFTITFQIYKEDREILDALRNPEHFQAMCAATGTIAPWVEPSRATPTSPVYGFGHMDSFWRSIVRDGRPTVENLLFVGDSCLRSNPKFGRGCTWSTLAAHYAAELLATEPSAAKRACRYEARLERDFRPDWHTMRAIDRRTEAAFEIASGRRAAKPAERATAAFEHLLDDALILEPDVFREVWRGYHGFRRMDDALKQPAVWPRLARAALARHRHRGLLEPARIRPSRAQLATAQQAAGCEID